MPGILIKNGRIIDPANNRDEVADIFIENDTISRIGKNLDVSAEQTIDAGGLLVVPGLIDIHVHLREPGQEDKETIFTGTRAAAAGGYTTIVAMPNTKPVIDTQADVDHIYHKAQRDALIEVFTTAAVTIESAGEQIAEFGDLYNSGAVAFTDDGQSLMNGEILRRALEYNLMFGVPVMTHCEDTNLRGDAVMNEGPTSAVLGLPASPGATESVMVGRDIELADHTGGHIHIQHVSARRSVELIRAGKERGVHVTAEATPHHLCLTEEAVLGFNTNAKMAPPLRTEDDRRAIIGGLRDGTLDCVATDHAPHTDMEKELPFLDAPFGVLGMETAFPVCYTHLVEKGEIDLPLLVKRMTCAPARIMGWKDKGALTEGARADVAIIDLNAERTVEANGFHSRSKNFAFLGQTLKGWPIHTIHRGRLVFSKGQILEPAMR